MNGPARELITLDDIHVWLDAVAFAIEHSGVGAGSTREHLRANWDTRKITIEITPRHSLIIHDKNQSLLGNVCFNFSFNPEAIRHRLESCVWQGQETRFGVVRTVVLYDRQAQETNEI